MALAAAFRDILIVGGGPAGLAAAIALRMEGLPVTVADTSTPPIDKSCGEGLMPDTIAALKVLGVEMPEGAGYPLKGVTFIDRGHIINGDFSENTARGLRRTTLHGLLVKRAAEVGVDLRWGARVKLHGSNRVSIDGQSHPASYVIGADGQNSRVRQHAGLAAVRFEQRRYGFRRHYRLEPWSNYVQLYWGRHSQLYITPIAQDEVGVALISGDPHLRLDQAVREFPELHRRLKHAGCSSKEMGSLTGSRSLQRVCRSNVALIGDASGSVDAITGEGMSLSFRQALRLAKACRAGDLFQYELAHRELRQRPTLMAALMLFLARREGLRRRAFASLAQRPEMFHQLLSIHVGESSFKQLLSWQLLPLSAAFLIA